MSLRGAPRATKQSRPASAVRPEIASLSLAMTAVAVRSDRKFGLVSAAQLAVIPDGDIFRDYFLPDALRPHVGRSPRPSLRRYAARLGHCGEALANGIRSLDNLAFAA